eukprot:6454525-Amphidinium_carterae.1
MSKSHGPCSLIELLDKDHTATTSKLQQSLEGITMEIMSFCSFRQTVAENKEARVRWLSKLSSTHVCILR